MSRIQACFARCRAEKRAAFIPFIMAGDPGMGATRALLPAMAEAGADIIELGIPFSDPMADGPVIQAAGLRALKAKTKLAAILEAVKDFRVSDATTPIVLMGYYNPIYRYGAERFAADAQASGVDGLIIVDLPPEEEAELREPLDQSGIALVRLIAPPSLMGRVASLAAGASGYVYYVSVAGVTGAAKADPAMLKTQLASLRAECSLPVAVGFGIKTPADVAAVKNDCDGVVVGSAIVQRMGELADEPIATITTEVSAMVRALSQAAGK